MPFGVFHQAVGEVLGRKVYFHEFGDVDRLREEYLTLRTPPTITGILELIPKEKLLVVKL